MPISLDPRSLLSQPRFYSAFENMLGARNFRKRFCVEVVGNSCNARILDIGCGTAEILEFLAYDQYVGLDVNKRYLDLARQKYPKNTRFERMDLLSADLQNLDEFDIVLALGFFHHIPDPAFQTLLKKIQGALRPGGRLISFDPCFHKGQHPLSKTLVSWDRGQFTRSFENYVELVKAQFSIVSPTLWTNGLSIPYSHCILEVR